MTLKARLYVRCTKEEKKFIVKTAKKLKLSLSQIILQAIRGLMLRK